MRNWLMGGEAMKIDIEKLRKDMKQNCYGAYFGGGFGGALMESFNVEKASPEVLIEMAKSKSEIDLSNYVVTEDGRQKID